MEASASLCCICQALIIDDSRHEGIAYCTEDAVQRLLFVDLLPEIEAGSRSRKDDLKLGIKRLPVPFTRDDVFPDLPCLTDSARAGCGFCAALKAALQSHELPELPARCAVSMMQAEYEWEVKIQEDNEDDWPQNLVLERLSLWVEVDDRIMFQLWFKITCPPGECARWLNIKRQPLLDYEFWDQGDIMLNSWVAETIDHLPARQENGKAPTRLLDVGWLRGNEQIRLVVTAQHPDVFGVLGERWPGYLALSHCWGETKAPCPRMLPTQKDNFSQYCEEIPAQAFPAPCRDAIRVTRALGFRYLWIDAFCIIQDDQADWEREFPRIADAYNNAYLTIAPPRSTSSHEGFLPTARTGARIPFTSAVSPEVRGEYSVHQLHACAATPRCEARDRCAEQQAAAGEHAFVQAARRLEVGAETLSLASGGGRVLADALDPDDLCPVCHLLLLAPVRTACGHAFCAACMARWAGVSARSSAVVPRNVKASCPMCRTLTAAAPDYQREYALRAKYPERWAERCRQEEEEDEGGEVGQ
ncbi:putative heterokaryon incompatibility protein [Neofusicoccum parvum UCRNP2]|uniref:Putative heterokaryon incompatibility protein n=1 Tax=Botryosphaeria parva (strain UCR-NP2) TaxID=1287680 RepID=R1GJP3_BOTPV|nr:putative heterokaryon incompatibility protein [Neofusicoccum parvum UCRNP2]